MVLVARNTYVPELIAQLELLTTTVTNAVTGALRGSGVVVPVMDIIKDTPDSILARLLFAHKLPYTKGEELARKLGVSFLPVVVRYCCPRISVTGSYDNSEIRNRIATSAGKYFPPVPLEMSPLTGVVSPLTGVVSPLTGGVSPLTGVVSPLTGVVSPLTGAVSPLTGAVSPLTGVDIGTGSLNTHGGGWTGVPGVAAAVSYELLRRFVTTVH